MALREGMGDREAGIFSRTQIHSYKGRRELAYYVPDPVLGALQTLSHLSLTLVLKNMDNYSILQMRGQSVK